MKQTFVGSAVNERMTPRPLSDIDGALTMAALTVQAENAFEAHELVKQWHAAQREWARLATETGHDICNSRCSCSAEMREQKRAVNARMEEIQSAR